MTTLFVIVLIGLIVPVVVYTSVKLGTVAFYRGRCLGKQQEDSRNGDAS